MLKILRLPIPCLKEGFAKFIGRDHDGTSRRYFDQAWYNSFNNKNNTV